MTIEELAAQLKEDILIRYKEGERLPSERILAQQFHSTQSKIHRALAILIKENLLYTRVGHGTFLSPLPKSSILFSSDENLYTANTSEYRKFQMSLKVRIPIGANYEERPTWEKIFQQFSDCYPYILIEPEYFSSETKVDVAIHTLHIFYRVQDEYQAFHRDEFGLSGYPAEDICDNCEKLISNENNEIQFIPICRVPSALFINGQLLDRYAIDPAIFSDCGKLFQLAPEIEREKKIAVTNYLGYHWHGCHYGLHIKEKNGICELDWDLLLGMFRDIKEFVTQGNLLKSTRDKLFQQGQMLSIYSYWPQKGFTLQDKSLLMIDPCRKNGYNPETLICAGVPKNCTNVFEAKLFASFLARPETQRILQKDFPKWIPVNKQVLMEQGRKDMCALDLRPYYSLFSKHIFHKFGPMINIAAARYCLDLMTPDQVMESLKKAAIVSIGR